MYAVTALNLVNKSGSKDQQTSCGYLDHVLRILMVTQK